MSQQLNWAPPPEIVVVIERTARVVAQGGGLELEKLILQYNQMVENMPYKPPGNKTVLRVEMSSFLKSCDHPYHEFYRKKRNAYMAQYQSGMLHFRLPRFDDLKPPPSRDDPPPPLFRHPPPPPGITLLELGLIKFTAQFVARYGIQFWYGLINMYMFPYFNFLKCTDQSFNYYNNLVLLYQRLLRSAYLVWPADEALGVFFGYLHLEKLDKNITDLTAFVSALDCLEDDAPWQHVPFSLMMLQDVDDIQLDAPQCGGDAEPDSILAYMFPVRISLKELGIIKLTALFVARYGQYFLRALMMREVMNPHFDFLFFRWDPRPQFPSMEPVEIRSHVFNVLVYAYSEVLMPSKMANDIDYCSKVVLGDFLQRLQLEKLEEGVKTAMIDLYALVAGVDYLAHMHEPQYSGIMSPPQRLSVMIKNLPTLQTHLGILVILPVGSKISDYPPHSSRSQCSSLAYTFPPGIRPNELGVIKFTALFVTRYGMSFMEALMKIAPTEFEFLKLTHIRRNLFLAFTEVYTWILKPSTKVEKSGDHIAKALEFFFSCLQLNKLKNGVATSVMELYLFMSGADYFAWMDVAGYSAIMAGPERRSMMLNRLTKMDTGGGLDQPPTLRNPLSFLSNNDGFPSPHEIGIIKLTAVFVARYGVRICRELTKKVDMKPVLKFMEPSDEMFYLYKMVVDAYSKILEVYDGAETKTVIERYFQCLQWEEQKKGSMSFDDDLYGFVEGVDCFAQMEDEYFSRIMGNHLVHVYNRPYHHQYESTSSEPKIDESPRVPEDYLTIKVWVPTVDGRKIIEIAVESLLETVSSLKEKIAYKIQMSAKDLKLQGKKGVLKGDKSLAHSDVETGDILTLTWRISRWTDY